jgi:hypothetical protein
MGTVSFLANCKSIVTCILRFVTFNNLMFIGPTVLEEPIAEQNDKNEH